MLKCQHIAEVATEYLEGRLGRRMRFQIRVHLLACPHCRRYVRQIRAVAQWLASLPVEAPPLGLEEQLCARFRAHAGPSP